MKKSNHKTIIITVILLAVFCLSLTACNSKTNSTKRVNSTSNGFSQKKDADSSEANASTSRTESDSSSKADDKDASISLSDQSTKEKAEADRQAKEKAEADRQAKEKAEDDRQAKEKAEKERLEEIAKKEEIAKLQQKIYELKNKIITSQSNMNSYNQQANYYQSLEDQARSELAAASSEKSRVYVSGVGWVYQKNYAAINNAQNKIDNYSMQKYYYADLAYNEQENINNYNKQIELYNREIIALS